MKASTIFINILSLASLYLAVSCNEEEQHGQTVRTIMATIEQSSTRTALDGPDADGVYKTIWSSDDAIAVFSGNNAASEFKLTSGANTNTAEFEGNAASDNMVAIYPYSIVKGRTGSTISVTLPEVQEYVSGNIPQGSYPMAAVSDGAILPFYNLCSVLRLRMFGELTVKSITFTPNDASTKASGNATVNAADKMLTMSSDAEATVKLNCANGVKLTRTSTDFLMVVPAQKYTGGFTITINTDQGAVVKAVKSDVTLSRSVLYPIKAFECKIEQSKDNIVFEDANFKAYMVTNFDTDNDGEISYEEALNVTKIEVNTDNITSLAGIEYMQNLQYLSCEGSSKWNSATQKVDIYGKLTSLDLSNNTKLSFLHVSYNPLISLDVDHNPKLEVLYCKENILSSLDISNNTAMKYLYAMDNPLATLFIHEGQTNSFTEIQIPSTTKIVVKGSEEPDDPEEWAGKEFWHKSLGMKFTATWCGYCPNLATSFAKAISQYPNKIEMLNLHPTSSNLGFSGTSKLENIFRITGYPTGMIDYRNSIANYTSNDYTARLIVNAAKETESNYPTKTGISFTSSVSGSKLNLNVKLYIKEKGDYKVTAVLLEDNIIGYQNGGGDNYNHSSIARVAITDITGDAVSTSEDNKTVSKNYTATIPSSCDKNNLRVLVYVLRQYGSQTIIRTADYGDYYVDNAISAAVGTTQDLVFSDGTVYGGNEDTKDGGEITLK